MSDKIKKKDHFKAEKFFYCHKTGKKQDKMEYWRIAIRSSMVVGGWATDRSRWSSSPVLIGIVERILAQTGAHSVQAGTTRCSPLNSKSQTGFSLCAS